VSITRTEWQLLQQFALNPGRILLHEELLTAVWGPEYRDDVVYLRLWVSQLRRKLGAEPWDEGIIRTVQGLGYAFDPEGRLPRMRSRRPGEAHEPGREAEAGTDDGEQPAREASLEREPAPAAEAEAPTGA
jgi:DNA-binding winged helix-turn-helix (wHTH) protein